MPNLKRFVSVATFTLMAGLILFGGTLLIQRQVAISQKKHELVRLDRETRAIRREIGNKKEQTRKLEKDPETITESIRNNLGYTATGEVIFKF